MVSFIVLVVVKFYEDRIVGLRRSSFLGDEQPTSYSVSDVMGEKELPICRVFAAIAAPRVHDRLCQC